MAPEMDQFYRSTMAIYKSILEQFNPALENLVYLGNNYLRAFHALSEAAEVYFSAIQKIGEQALQSSTSQILGEILVQMSDTQRHLNSDLEVVVQTFHGDLLQHMEKNTKLDMQFIKDSRQHYEIEYRHRAANLEKCMSELWRMERKRDKNVREMKESVNRLHAQMQTFVSESQRAAELEEKRRYRFLAEKHLLLSNTFLQFFGRARGTLQNGTLCFPSRSGWFPEAYVKPLEEVPVNPMNALNPVTSMNPMNALNPMTSMNPMNPLNPVTSMNPMSPMNELPSRSYPLRGSHSLDDLLDRPGNATAPSEYWDGQPRSRTPSRVPSRAPSPAPTPLPGSRRGSMGSTGVASDIKKLMSWEQQPPELFPRGTNPFATVKLRPTVTNDRSAPLIR
ncbi:PREDICTED: brain-specific angiogenesis inhibitor 1-associated protein 2-like protein 2 [Myotis davidii]|uniref:brain-specific angiogenesis inhibitor 1-associated protein 2-like protein 2 n=1 Tax=Myotis davidii TaxID=225400 RepID=UPI0003EC05F6|nr:PREDICTED: brain-specific angiogenesis inhibitor 1-associated protein 2-like protein 2 [Myotis davidii]